MSYEVFFMLLLVTSVLCSLTVEALKKMLEGKKIVNEANILAGVVSVILSLAIGICYCITTNTAFNPTIVISIIALIFLSWLCAMLGYDKVMQTIKQIKF